jgi:hypothetical protein
MPTGHQVLLAESVDEIGTPVLIEEGSEERIGPVDHIDHECLHLLIAEARELGPRDFTGRGPHRDVRVVASFRMRGDSRVEVFQDRVSEALLCHILGQALQDLWILGQKPCAIAIHKLFPAPAPPDFNQGRRRAIVWWQLKWLLPLVFCRSDPDAPRWDLGAVTSECCSASNGGGLVSRVNQRNGLPGMRSRTGEVRPISRDRGLIFVLGRMV